MLNRSMLIMIKLIALILLCHINSSIFCQAQTQHRLLVINNSAAQIAKEKIRKALASIGLIKVRNNDAEHLRPRGSGVVVRNDGIIATNYHVIKQDQINTLYPEIYIEFNNSNEEQPTTIFPLKVISINPQLDLALLRINIDTSSQQKFAAIEIGNSQRLQLLDDIVIIGYPEKGGKTVTVNLGIIEGFDPVEKWIKTDARLIRGNSGGAAVDRNGQLIGIPTKVVADNQQIDKNGDGIPDTVQSLGAVGFLRPADLIESLLKEIDQQNSIDQSISELKDISSSKWDMPLNFYTICGFIYSEDKHQPIAGARIGIIPAQNSEVTPNNLLAWGGSNAEGWFELNRPMPPGSYCLKVQAIGYEAYTKIVEVKNTINKIEVQLRKLP